MFLTNQCICGNKKNANTLPCTDCRRDIDNFLSSRTFMGVRVNKSRFYSYFKQSGFGLVGTCAICGSNYILGGNNPAPIINDQDARCCQRCNNNEVIPARIHVIMIEYYVTRLMTIS
jgi:hypothetical protein